MARRVRSSSWLNNRIWRLTIGEWIGLTLSFLGIVVIFCLLFIRRQSLPYHFEHTFTVSDPETWTKPWSASIPWHSAGPMYEYACQEDNIDMYGILTGARANDQKTGESPKKGLSR